MITTPPAGIVWTKYITPYKIVLLQLVVCFCRSEFGPDVDHQMAIFLADNILDSEVQPEPTMKKLRKSLSDFDEPAVVRSLDQATRRIQNPDNLNEFFRLLISVVEEGEAEDTEMERVIMDKHGIFSEFVRRCRIEYLRSSFEQTSRLFEIYRAYVDGKAEEQEIESTRLKVPSKRPLPGDVEDGTDTKTIRKSTEREPGWLSWHRLEHVFSTQVEMIEKTGDSDISPSQLDSYLDLIQRHAPELAKVHQLRFINYIRTNEYEGALSSLHRFFDYCLSDQEVPMYQYVLLHLGILETKFGHIQQARLALDEALEVAREASDQNCINEVLSWSRFIKGVGSSIEDPPYIASDETTEESNVVYLQSLHKISQAQDMIRCGDSPEAVLDAISRSAVQTTAHDVSALTQTQHLMKALIFQYYGNNDLSDVYMDMALTTENGSMDVIEKSCILAAEKLMASGKYEMALDALQIFQTKHPDPCGMSLRWKQTLARVKRQMYRAGKMSIQPKGRNQEDILALTNPEDLEQAFYTLHQQAIELYEQDDPAESIRVLEEARTILETAGHLSALADNSIAQAYVYLEDGDPEPAIHMLQNAFDLCQKTSDAPHYFASVLKMAEARLLLNTPEETAKAIDILEENFPKILGMGSGSLQPALYFVYARALHANNSPEEALHYADKAIQGFRELCNPRQLQKAVNFSKAVQPEQMARIE